MRFAFGLTLTFSSGHALAHDGPLFSMAHADFWGMWLIALAILRMSVSVTIAVRTKTLPQPPVEKGVLALKVIEDKDLGAAHAVRSLSNA